MQRIGRVDRRMNPQIEARIIADHPQRKAQRGKTAFWNFLPPDELDDILRLFQRVTHKTLVISRTMGIEGRKLLTPDDEFDPIKELNEQCDGQLSDSENLRLEYERLMADQPDLAKQLAGFPLKVFSGKENPVSQSRAVFFCYRIPRPDGNQLDAETGQPRWSDTAGLTVWACLDLEGKIILTDVGAIANLIRSTPENQRKIAVDRNTLSNLRKQLEKQLTASYLRPQQAPLGVAPVLKCWMELN